jgi:predicted transcriptional regulator
MVDRPDRGSTRTRRAAGALEGEVLATLWAADEPMTPVQIHAVFGGELAYNTVHTILTRLQEKGLVDRVQLPGATRRAYAPAKDAAQVAADRMRMVLDGSRNRAQILQRFVTSLDADDEQALRAALGPDRPE